MSEQNPAVATGEGTWVADGAGWSCACREDESKGPFACIHARDTAECDSCHNTRPSVSVDPGAAIRERVAAIKARFADSEADVHYALGWGTVAVGALQNSKAQATGRPVAAIDPRTLVTADIIAAAGLLLEHMRHGAKRPAACPECGAFEGFGHAPECATLRMARSR